MKTKGQAELRDEESDVERSGTSTEYKTHPPSDRNQGQFMTCISDCTLKGICHWHSPVILLKDPSLEQEYDDHKVV